MVRILNPPGDAISISRDAFETETAFRTAADAVFAEVCGEPIFRSDDGRAATLSNRSTTV